MTDSNGVDAGGQSTDGLTPEAWSLRQARRAFLFAVMTPIWWVFMLVLITLLAELFPSTNGDSILVLLLWGAMALLYTITVTYTGLQQGRLIRGYGERRGLWYARGAVIVGVITVVASIGLIFALFTGGDLSSRPLI